MNNQAGRRQAAVRRESWLCVAAGPAARALPPARGAPSPAVWPLQTRTSILPVGQAEVSFSELRPGLARCKCRPKRGVSEDKTGPSEILGFEVWKLPPGSDTRPRTAGFAGTGGWNVQRNSGRDVQARMTLPPALISFQSPACSQVGISSLSTRED